MRASQPVVARPHVLPCADDATAWIHLYRWWDQEFGPSFHAIKRVILHSFQTTNTSCFSVNRNLQMSYMQHVAGLFVCLISKQIKWRGTVMLFVFHLVLMHKSYKVNTCWEHFICTSALPLSIHSQHTTYFETVTLTQLMLTLSCQRVHFKGFWKRNRQNGWFRVGLSMTQKCDAA